MTLYFEIQKIMSLTWSPEALNTLGAVSRSGERGGEKERGSTFSSFLPSSLSVKPLQEPQDTLVPRV
jgi:hypothetical protein